jgi:hypothetical protein
VAGKTDLEDAVKRLDNLTQEEARMAIAEVLRITHNVRNVVEAVDGKVADVGDKVQGVDEKVQIVIDGAHPPIGDNRYFLTLILSDGKDAIVEAKVATIIMQQTANSVDEIKCA